MFQSATCVFVFLLPQQLSALSAGLHRFLIDRPERSHCVLPQRFQIGEFNGECKQISDEKCVSTPSHAGHEAADQGRPDYFGSLGAAFLYTAASCAAEAQPLTYTRDSHFSPLEREPSSGISLFRSVPRCVTFDGSSLGQVVETRVPGVEGALHCEDGRVPDGHPVQWRQHRGLDPGDGRGYVWLALAVQGGVRADGGIPHAGHEKGQAAG